MTDFVRISFLLDFYGGLLTDRNFAVMDMHFNEDRSLTEIGEQLGISRQAVSDIISRSSAKLESFERALGLGDRFLRQRDELTSIRDRLSQIERGSLSRTDADALDSIDIALKDMIGDL